MEDFRDVEREYSSFDSITPIHTLKIVLESGKRKEKCIHSQ